MGALWRTCRNGSKFRPRGSTRVDISGGIQASLAGRYAIALFELANERKQLDAVGESLAALKQTLADSEDFRELTTSPLIGRDQAVRAVAASAGAMKLDPITANFLGVLARNGRKGELPNVIRLFRRLAAENRGETTAEVVTARALNDDQIVALKTKLRARAGREVAIETHIDPEILGGLVVKLGSQMIDSSIRTKLNRLTAAMKG